MAARGRNANGGGKLTLDPPNPAPVADPQGELIPPDLAEDTTSDLGFFDHLRSLPRGVRESSLIYIYRVEPKVKKSGKYAYIERVSAEGFDEEWLKEKHGGGKYRLWLNTPNQSQDLQRYADIAGPAKIYPDQVLVDAEGNALPAAQPAPAAASAQPVTPDAIAQIVTTAIQAVKDKGASADEAFAQAMGVMRKAQEGSIEILTSSLKNQVNNGGDSATAALLKEMLAEIRSQRNNPGDRKLDKIVDAGLERLLNPPAQPGPLDFIKQLKDLQELDGLSGILGGSPKENGAWWEPLVGKLADALSDTLKANGAAIIEAYREKLRVDAFLAQQNARRPAQPAAAPIATAQTPPGTPAPSVPQAAPSLPLPIPVPAGPGAPPPEFPPHAAPQAQPAPVPVQGPHTPTEMTEEQVFDAIRRQITELIVTCYEENDSGVDAAITVKRAHRPLLALIRPQFKDFNQVLALAQVDPVLKQIAGAAEFPEFAREFHEEFMRDE